MKIAGWAGAALLAVATLVLGGPVYAAGEPSAASAPTITLDHSRVRTGDKMIVTFNGWQSRNATLAVCGNLARRGSSDCDLVGGQGVTLAIGAPRMVSEFTATLPPVPCPCLVEAWNTAYTEVAFAPLDIIGAPVGPVSDPVPVVPLALSVGVRPSPGRVIDRLRAGLGGKRAYELTVSLRNQSGVDLSDVAITATAGRSASVVTRSVDVAPPPLIPGGQTWTHRQRVMLPALTPTRIVWDVTASGPGAPLHADVITRATPTGLLVVVALLVADVCVIVARRLRRDRRRLKRQPPDAGAVPHLRLVGAPASSAA